MHYTGKAALSLEACRQCNVKIKSLKSECALFLSSSHPNTHKHKKVDWSSWISLWPSEYICGPQDYPGPDTLSSLLRASASSPKQCSMFLDIVFSSNDGTLLQKPFFFKIRTQLQSGCHVPQFPTPIRQHTIKQQMKKEEKSWQNQERFRTTAKLVDSTGIWSSRYQTTKCTAMNDETSLQENLAPQQDEQRVKTPGQRQQHKDLMWFCWSTREKNETKKGLV